MDDEKMVRVLRALGDERRFRMVREIAAAGELSCGQLGERFDLAQPTISHHLKILVDAGVIRTRRDAQHHFISVDQGLLDELGMRLPVRFSAGEPKRRVKARR